MIENTQAETKDLDMTISLGIAIAILLSAGIGIVARHVSMSQTAPSAVRVRSKASR